MRWWILAVAMALSACGGTADNNETENNTTNGTPNSAQNGTPNGEPATGEALYSGRLDGANTFTCATCHALSEPADDGITRPGHPIGDAFARSSYKNGRVDSLRDAVNSCVEEWMAGTPFTDDDPDWILLRDFLAEQAPQSADDLTFEITQPPADVSGGDPDAGLAAFDRTCSVCHGAGGGGTDKAPPVAGLELEPDYIAERIRLSGSSGSSGSAVYDGLTGGRMPFWAPDRLSDDDLIDIVAYVADSEMVEPGNNINANPNNTNNTELRDCESTHPKVGQTLQFSELFHDVAGQAEIIDDCTIELQNFNYDGTGIDVRIYAALGANFGSGFAISEDLLRPEPYQNETLTLQLPEDRTLDDLDSLSVWCVAVGQDFGSGTFE